MQRHEEGRSEAKFICAPSKIREKERLFCNEVHRRDILTH